MVLAGKVLVKVLRRRGSEGGEREGGGEGEGEEGEEESTSSVLILEKSH